jgi:hypothetical protein
MGARDVKCAARRRVTSSDFQISSSPARNALLLIILLQINLGHDQTP